MSWFTPLRRAILILFATNFALYAIVWGEQFALGWLRFVGVGFIAFAAYISIDLVIALRTEAGHFLEPKDEA